ncbi:MAG: translation initiation factor IF-2 [Gemmatimonadetes bacterium]|nr:translation initiation factor IF-2 [Gemmatimonadota bacterium]
MATKTRVHDIAAEFGIPSEQLIQLLADLGVHVRSHLSSLDSGQTALVRARWERDKRRKSASDPKKKTKRRTKKTARAPEAEPAPTRPRRRRRPAAEVAARAEKEERILAAAAAEVEQAAMAIEPAAREQTLEERAAALFKDAPAVSEAGAEAPAAPGVEVVTPPAAPEDVGVAASEEVAAPVLEASQPAAQAADSAAKPTAPAETAGPGPVKPLRVQRPARAPRIKPVASAAPKPVASAAPGEPTTEERGREKGGKKRRKGGKRSQVDQAAVQANISRTLASLKGGPRGKGHRRGFETSFRERETQRLHEEKEREKTLVRVNEFITVSELSDILKVNRTEIVSFCFKELGMMVTVNQRLDFDQIELIAGAFGFQAVQEEEYSPTDALQEAEADTPENLRSRPPVVTVMGHVDHGKTSLLDHIRKANVIAGEAGGITQHIGAYHVEVADGKGITFLDTPGHQAFTAMRARGAQITDLVVLVVAADDQVMPQTIEAISHAKNAGVPLVVAINKIDLPSANVEKVKQDLLQHEVILEEFGGETLASPISAKTGQGIEELLEKILLQAELLDKKANPDRDARGTVVESSLDAGKGPVATILIQNGTLKIGANFICGNLSGRVRAMLDERGQRVEEAGPSMPVQVLGLDGVPQAGDHFTVVRDARTAREIAQKRQRLDREAVHRRASRGLSLEDLSRKIEEGDVQALKIIIKADQDGPAEALADAFAQLSTDEVAVRVIHRGVGAITESDVLLAKASEAVVVGFHVRPDSKARAAAERERVDIRTYRVIYEAVEEMRSALEGLLAPEEREIVLGSAEVLQIFKISGLGVIAGCLVSSGTITRAAKVRVVRDGVEIYDSVIASLRRFKDDVREVKEGLECGIGIENFNDVKVRDVLEAYRIEQIARTLEVADTGEWGAQAKVSKEQ